MRIDRGFSYLCRGYIRIGKYAVVLVGGIHRRSVRGKQRLNCSLAHRQRIQRVDAVRLLVGAAEIAGHLANHGKVPGDLVVSVVGEL